MPSQLFPAPLPLKPRRFTSRALFVVFRTATDLSPWVPAPVVLADPHMGIFKVWRTKSRFLGEDADPLLMSQFEEAVIGVLAAVPGSPQRHYNLLNLHSQPWAVGRGNQLGHRLRNATIEMTWTFPHGPEFDLDTDWPAFDVDVHRLGNPIACFRGALGETEPRFPEPDYNGFVNVSFQTDGDGRLTPPIVVEDTLADLTLGRVTYGGGDLEFFGSPDDSPIDAALLSALGTVEVLGCALRDLGWTRNFPR